MRARRLQIAGVAVLGLIAAYLPSVGRTDAEGQIAMQGFAFSPTPLLVKTGSTVTWTNKDDEPHTVVSNTGEFRSAGLDTNDTFSHRFDQPGTYRFTCSLHPRMVGAIVVR